MTHPNIIAGCLREAVQLWDGPDPFDPQNEADCQWLRGTFNFLMSLALDYSDEPMAQTQAAVMHAVPGTEVVQHVQSPAAPIQQPPPVPMPQQQPQAQPVQQFPQQQPTMAGTPAPVQQLYPGADDDTKWANLLHELATSRFNNGNTEKWFDNRGNKKNTRSPDFRHKELKDPPNQKGDIWPTSLYVKDAPPWALQALQQYAVVIPDPQYQNQGQGQQFQQPPPNQPVMMGQPAPQQQGNPF